ncbi:amidohydrolase [Acidobacteria bacterium AB60]|nr:amidohydrolase [Acidobacteria bacterium AB60]
MKTLLLVVGLLSCWALSSSQAQRAPDVAPFISVSAPVVAIEHVRVIDGTGAPSKDDQTIVVSNGKIAALGPAASLSVPAEALRIDGHGETVLPGLVGMHDHLYYTTSASDQLDASGRVGEPGIVINEIPFTAPRLYLAAGVTTMRTTGSVEPYADLRVKRLIEEELMVGPHIDASAPYLEGWPTAFAQMHSLTGPDDAVRLVDYWAAEGMTSFKAYQNITRAELSAAIAEAHKRSAKITGHLCSVTWKEAVEMGIDNLEHGPVFTDSGLVANKKPDECPTRAAMRDSWSGVDVGGPEAQSLIHLLIEHKVAVTSTLPVFEASVPGRPRLQQRVLDAMSAEARQSYLTSRARVPLDSPMTAAFRKELEFERAFAKAGGLLLAGPDPTGNGGVLPGFGDQREVELLVEAGFTPVEAIQIATEDGAKFLGRESSIGTIAPGKQADLVLVKGDPATTIADIENVETVFKDGVGYDSKKLIESVRGQVGIR